METVPLGVYQHYKGSKYEVIGVALHTETHETLVLYKPLYCTPEMIEECGSDPIFARPYNQFIEIILVEEKHILRFTQIHE